MHCLTKAFMTKCAGQESALGGDGGAEISDIDEIDDSATTRALSVIATAGLVSVAARLLEDLTTEGASSVASAMHTAAAAVLAVPAVKEALATCTRPGLATRLIH